MNTFKKLALLTAFSVVATGCAQQYKEPRDGTCTRNGISFPAKFRKHPEHDAHNYWQLYANGIAAEKVNRHNSTEWNCKLTEQGRSELTI